MTGIFLSANKRRICLKNKLNLYLDQKYESFKTFVMDHESTNKTREVKKERVMKRIVLSFSIIILCGCSSESLFDGIKNELVKDYGFKMEEELITYISENYNPEEDYSMGNGIEILNLDKDSKDQQMFPVYCNDQLIFLIIYDQKMVYLSDQSVLSTIKESDEYLIINAEDNVYYISKDKIMLLNGEEKELSDSMKKKIEKIRNGNIDKNLMGIEKREIRIVSGEEKELKFYEDEYRNDSVIIRFFGDGIEKKIRMYEAFCHGRVQDKDPDNNIYVFYFGPLDSKNLKILLDASNNLGYVLEASLVEKEKSFEEEIDLTAPVTEKVPFE